MLTLIKIALRNILRNKRRSAMTIGAIAVGAVAMLVFASYLGFVVLGYRTGVVETVGHLAVYKNGYFEVGSGNPGGYGIADYDATMKLIHDDPVVGPTIEVLTPTVTLYGLASNSAIDTSKTFLGVGIVPSDHERMIRWNEYHLHGGPPRAMTAMSDADPTRGVVGTGLARILGLCQPLQVADCVDPPNAPHDFPDATSADGLPKIDLLAAAAGGAPSIVNLTVTQAQGQGVKEFDDSFVAMHIALAQQLLYGKGEPKVTSIVLQLHHTADIPMVRQRLEALFKEKGLDLELRDYTELAPQYNQTVGMFDAIFAFISVIMGVIVLFAVINTMGMSVMERTNEIGTTRALGVRRRGIRRQFLAEGSMLGFIGATLGLVVAWAITVAINAANLTWIPPGQVTPVPFLVLFAGIPALIVFTWVGLILIATLAALAPAARAAKMPVVDALRHV